MMVFQMMLRDSSQASKRCCITGNISLEYHWNITGFPLTIPLTIPLTVKPCVAPPSCTQYDPTSTSITSQISVSRYPFMKISNQTEELEQTLKALDTCPMRVLVPTMGCLHQGHIELIHRARQLAGQDGSVILSVFVNPTQFDKAEDLENYPRSLERDLSLCREHGVDIVYAPAPAAMYHPDHSITVSESALSSQLCGATRPGHFDGVCTVVLKLINLTQPAIAVFGKKDYQQLAVIRRMVRDLNVPVKIEGVDTIREKSGLALSSRNERLSPAQHADAARIRRALLAARKAHQQGEVSAQTLLGIARTEIEASEVGAVIDYLELLDSQTLQHIDRVNSAAVMATAVFYGKVRLIDNIELA